MWLSHRRNSRKSRGDEQPFGLTEPIFPLRLSKTPELDFSAAVVRRSDCHRLTDYFLNDEGRFFVQLTWQRVEQPVACLNLSKA